MSISTGTWVNAAAVQLGSRIQALGTLAPDIVTVVPRDEGHYQPAEAADWWVNVEQVSAETIAETSASYRVRFTLGVWVWKTSLGVLPTAASDISLKAELVHKQLLYSDLAGWARTGIANDDMSVGQFVKSGQDNVRYGYHFTVVVTKQLGV